MKNIRINLLSSVSLLNNFGAQEPGANGEIAEFCKKNYGVTFPMAEKVSVKGDDIDPLFKWLVQTVKRNG
jgi:glutathione peroxidase